MSPEDALLLIQGALVLVGSTSRAINMERRRIACMVTFKSEVEIVGQRGLWEARDQPVWAGLSGENIQKAGSR